MVSMVKGFTVCLTHSHMLESEIKAIVMPPRETGLNPTKLQLYLLLARLLICTLQRNIFKVLCSPRHALRHQSCGKAEPEVTNQYIDVKLLV